MAGPKTDSTRHRLPFLDNLRTFLIFLVVLYHVGWVYEQSGLLSSVWIVNDPARNDFVGLFNMILDIFMMPAMFFVSGYLVPVSLARQGGAAFVWSRFKRLMIPWLLAAMFLVPACKAIFLYSRGLPPQDLAAYFHFFGGSPMNQGWLWFLPILFCFDLLYWLLDKLKLARPRLGLKSAVALVFLIGLAHSLFMSFEGLYGWTKTILLDFQNERLLIYFLMFLLGSWCFHWQVLLGQPDGKVLYFTLCGTIWLPMNVYIIFLLNLVFNPGHYILGPVSDAVLAWLGFHLSLLGLLYICLATFRFYFNRSDRLWGRLAGWSYGVYIVHFPLMGLAALLLRPLPLPSLLKYVLAALATYAAGNLATAIYKSIRARLAI